MIVVDVENVMDESPNAHRFYGSDDEDGNIVYSCFWCGRPPNFDVHITRCDKRMEARHWGEEPY
jgi:hypothetical protein